MAIEIRVPEIGESITEVEIGDWLKKTGDAVRRDEPLVSLESEKATLDLPAPESGTLVRVLRQKGEVAKVGEVIAVFETGTPAKQETPASAAPKREPAGTAAPEGSAPRVMPAAAAAMAAHKIDSGRVTATGPGGRILKEDVLRTAEAAPKELQAEAPAQQTGGNVAAPTPVGTEAPAHAAAEPGREEEVIPMSRLRRTVAERLVEAQHTAALLTTFNEIDMTAVMGLRKEYGESFQKKHDVKLGFMSFFVKAVIDGLKLFPVLNAEVRGQTIAYHNYYDIGVAVGSGKGLVVPVLRNAERMSFAEIEVAIGDFARRAKENKLKLEELHGGTFTISNGGVYGSLLSTPIVNPPQSGVLGLHSIQERPVVRDGTIVARSMMYVALTYDHRVVDGREAVSFLKRVKDAIESPARMLIEI